MSRLADLLSRIVYVRYVAASAISLGVDLAIFLALSRIGLPAAAASAIGYLAGVAVHWAVSSRAVFASAMASEAAGRQRQQVLFLASALAGLGLTVGIIGIADSLMIDTRIAKLVAIMVSFQATYILRKRIVFA